MPRRPKDAGPSVNRNTLLQAAVRIGEKQGWPALTIRSLADAVGYTSPVLYEHFRSKEHLLLDVAKYAFSQLNHELASTFKRCRARDEMCVLRLCRAYTRFATQHTSLYLLISGMGGVVFPADALNDAAQQVCDTTALALRPWGLDNGLDERSIRRLADELWVILHGVCAITLQRGVRLSSAPIVRTYLRGVSRRP
jgi:AcrR family transcriptional regulator